MDILEGLEDWEVQNLVKGWLANQAKAGTLTAAQEAVLVQASPILFNMLLTAFLQKQQASAVPTPPGA